MTDKKISEKLDDLLSEYWYCDDSPSNKMVEDFETDINKMEKQLEDIKEILRNADDWDIYGLAETAINTLKEIIKE